MYLLDTDHVVILQTRPRGDFDRLVERMSRHSPADFYVPIVAFHEQMLGWNAYISRSRDTAGVVRGYDRMHGLLEYFGDAQVLQFDVPAAQQFDHFRSASPRVGTMDLRIAAIALSHDMTVLTRNTALFRDPTNQQRRFVPLRLADCRHIGVGR